MAIRKQIEDLRKQIDDLQGNFIRRKEELIAEGEKKSARQFSLEIEKLKSEKAALGKRISELQNFYQTQINKITASQPQIQNDLRKKYETDIANLNKSFLAERAIFQQTINNEQNEINNLKSQVQELQATIAASSQFQHNLTTEVSKVEKEKNFVEQQAKSIDSELQREINLLKGENDKYLKRQKEVDAHYKYQLAQLEKRNRELLKQVEDLKREYARLIQESKVAAEKYNHLKYSFTRGVINDITK
jgi:chromosome segregation ATPase